jgi:hypothetical protein
METPCGAGGSDHRQGIPSASLGAGSSTSDVLHYVKHILRSG